LRGSSKGAEIRAKIAANRAKRLRIAEAMKNEAGVTAHSVNKENLAGLAYIGTGGIYSPEGRKIVRLYTLAHECGHIFLHNSGAGYTLPGHVKEFEAESYAHQAFREHGMTLPLKLSNWGRTYVGSWIEKDRATNIPIDPRAMAYAAGRRSPYEPLRLVPATWHIFRAAVPAWIGDYPILPSYAGRISKEARGRPRRALAHNDAVRNAKNACHGFPLSQCLRPQSDPSFCVFGHVRFTSGSWRDCCTAVDDESVPTTVLSKCNKMPRSSCVLDFPSL
jgi:hypothetical protein